MLKSGFSDYLLADLPPGSNKASSYIRALDMLGEVLTASHGSFADIENLWVEDCPQKIDRLYEYIKGQQKSGEIFDTGHAPSYWKNGFYSAALRAFRDFLIGYHYEIKLESFYSSGVFDPINVDDAIEDENLLIRELDRTEATERIRVVKARVGQEVFKRELRAAYGSECCVTGLNVPELNRASHIVPWRDREVSRLDPGNGLYLSATYDAAFDRYLFTLDEDFRIVLSRELRGYFAKPICADYFERYEGKTITLPCRNTPKQEYLSHHRARLGGS